MTDPIQTTSQEIGFLLVKTLDPDRNVRKAAEDGLSKLETTNKFYGLATLYLTTRDDLDNQVRVAASIALKNYIKKNWQPDLETEEADKIGDEQRELIKQHITKFMLKSSEHIQRQLSEAITIIGQSDFPDKWPSLIVELETSLKENFDPNSTNIQGILQTAHSIFRRYRYELPSNKLWSEIKLVIEHFGQPLTDRFKDLIVYVKTINNEPAKLSVTYKSLLLCTKIFHSLIVQDLPEFFEDRLGDWVPQFLDLLTVQVQLPDETSVIEDMKSEICEIASIIVQRFADVENFKEYTQRFAENIWNLLITANQDVRFDTLVSTAIRYLVAVAERPETRPLFQDANVLNLLCQNVILPNSTLREVDEELFEDDPEEYVKRDIEGSDVDTRRRAVCDLVRDLCKFQEAQLIEILGCCIEDMLKKYEENRVVNWKLKDLAIFLYSATAIRGSTRQDGTVSISPHVNVEKFFEEKIADCLITDSNHPGVTILAADALRYITTFRNYIPLSTIFARLPLILKHITSNNIVVRTYASITLEKLLTIRAPNQPQTTALKPEQFEPFLGELIKTLFDALDMPGSPENEHIMKTIMRLFSFSKSILIVQYLPVVVPKLTNKLGAVARNPSKPYFNHYLFETLALTIRAACSQDNPAMRNDFESVLFNILEVVLAQDVQEFTPYVFQLLNLILNAQPSGSISDRFTNLFQELLSPTFWERPANVKPLAELLHTYIEKNGQIIVAQNKLDPVLGIFQKLIASKATDHEALALLQRMMIHLPAQQLDARIREIFVLMFQRLTGSKTNKFVRHTLVCFSLFAYLRGAEHLASVVNQLQKNMFGMVIEKLYLPDVKKVTGYIERRICSCGIIKILTQLPLIDDGAYNNLWAPLLTVLLEIFELPPETMPDDEDHFVESESLDFQAQYSRLNYASRRKEDPIKELDLKALLATSLANLSVKLPRFVRPTMQGNLDQGALKCVLSYCEAANVRIV